MQTRPNGLWPFTEMVINQIEFMGCPLLKIEAHDSDDIEGSDFLWGTLTPHLSLSEGDYMYINQDSGFYSTCFGTRGCCGGDPTYDGGQILIEPTEDNAVLVAKDYCEYFTCMNS